MSTPPLSQNRLLDRLPASPRIAVLRASRIGDFLCALPALNDLKRALPSCELTLIALPMVLDLASRVPCIDRSWAFPGFPGIAEQFFRPRVALAFFARVQSEGLDLVIQMHGSGAYSNPFALMLGGRLTAGFAPPGDAPVGGHAALLDLVLPLPEDLSEVNRCRALVALLGAGQVSGDPWLHLHPHDHAAAALLLGSYPRPWIGFHPWARDRHKIWPLARYAHLADRLTAVTGGTVFLLGSGDDAGEGVTPKGLVDLTGRTSLVTLAAVIAALHLLVANDSGPAHLAYALGTPTVTLFGGTDPGRWGPRDWPGAAPARHRVVVRPAVCRPCEMGECATDYHCLRDVAVEDVLVEALGALAAA